MSLKSLFLVASIAMRLPCAAWAQIPTEPVLKAELAVCTSIVDRTPQGSDTTYALAVDSLYCWTKITGASDETSVTHVWLHEGEVVAQVALPVRSGFWRTWSLKKLYGAAGNWEVKVVDATGNTLGRVSFTVTP